MSFGTTNAVVLSGVIVVAGRYAEGNGVSGKVVIGTGFLTLAIATMGEINQPLASAFATLILVAAFLRYGLVIIQKTGLTK